MVTSLIEIASELASLYPTATSDEIAEAIIRSIESELVLRETFKAVRLPERLEVQAAKLKSQRLPRKQAVRMQEKIGFLSFFEKVKASYTTLGYSPSVPSVAHNGSRVTFETRFGQTNNGNVRIPGVEITKSGLRVRVLESIEAPPVDDQWLILAKGSAAHDVKEFIISPSRVLEEIRERVQSRQPLSFDDVGKINRALKFADEEGLSEILRLLDTDLQLRKEAFKVDCIKELYRGDDVTPKELRTAPPSPRNVRELIHERVKAILTHEYRRLHRLAGSDFVNGKIPYDEYVKKTERYAIDAGRLYPREL